MYSIPGVLGVMTAVFIAFEGVAGKLKLDDASLWRPGVLGTLPAAAETEVLISGLLNPLDATNNWGAP